MDTPFLPSYELWLINARIATATRWILFSPEEKMSPWTELKTLFGSDCPKSLSLGVKHTNCTPVAHLKLPLDYYGA